MPTPPQSATLNQATTITWSDGDLFNGFLLLGLVMPRSGDRWAEVDLGGQSPAERIPIFTRVPITDGKFDNTVGVLYTSSISPPHTQYAAWYYDASTYPPREIAGPSTFFTVSTPTLTPPILTLTSPTPGNQPPTPDAG